MAVLGASFQIGRSALAAYQAAISVVGQNIANVGNPDYTRQSGRLSPIENGLGYGGVTPGAGVRMSALTRHADEAVESRLRMALGTREAATASLQSLAQLETFFNELTGEDLSTQLGEMFSSFSSLQTTPTETTTRNLTVAAADNLIASLHRQRRDMVQLAGDLNTSVVTAVRRANEIAEEVAGLNQQIVVEESRGFGASSPLRDRRDALLRELGGLMDIRSQPQQNGSVNLYIGGEPLVEFAGSRGLTVETELQDGLELTRVRFADNNGTVVIRDGQIAGLLRARDQNILGVMDRLDRLANGLIYEVNRAHSTGRGLVGYRQITGSYSVMDTSTALNSDDAGVPFPVQNGTLIVHVRSTETGREITRQIEIDLDGLNGDDTSLAGFANLLNGIDGLSASVTTDNRLRIVAADGSEVSFSEDTSGVLAALGVATFFQGQHAGDIDINPAIRSDVRLIAASLTGEAGDGDNAGRIASVGAMASDLLDFQTLEDFHTSTINRLAVDASAARTAEEAADAIHTGLTAQRESISGVSLDEEAINLAKFEKAFQGATRFLSVVDQLADEVLGLVR